MNQVIKVALKTYNFWDKIWIYFNRGLGTKVYTSRFIMNISISHTYDCDQFQVSYHRFYSSPVILERLRTPGSWIDWQAVVNSVLNSHTCLPCFIVDNDPHHNFSWCYCYHLHFPNTQLALYLQVKLYSSYFWLKLVDKRKSMRSPNNHHLL